MLTETTGPNVPGPAPAASPPEAGIDFVFGFPAADLIPAGHVWRDSASGQQKVPLALCEFLAYKAALTYASKNETPEAWKRRVRTYLERCCEGIEHVGVFDTRDEGIADTQGYGFLHQGRAYVILRGSESEFDWWTTNVDDFLTDALSGADDKRLLELGKQLKNPQWDVVEFLGGKEPGRHLGFATAWAAVRDQVETWIKTLPNGEGRPFVFAGHSLGGALAILGAYEFARNGRQVDAVVTFGAPAVGNTAFAAQYARLLADRTILVESQGDSVPVLMRRWYYQWIWRLRQWINSGTRPGRNPNYAAVSQALMFNREPPLSASELSGAIAAVNELWTKARVELEKAESGGGKPKENGGSKPQPDAAEQDKSPAGRGQGKSDDGAKQSTAPGGQTGGKGQDAARWVLIGVFVVFALVIVLVIWAYIRKKIASHDIQKRYALYLSTLSYQRLRALSLGDVTLANKNLKDHLRFVRGNTALDSERFFGLVENLPIELTKEQAAQALLDGSKTHTW